MAKKKTSFGKFVGKLKREEDFRAEMKLYGGAIFNLFFAGTMFYSGIRYQSAWFIALGIYYAVLTIVKFYIGISSRWRGSKKKWRVLRNSGIVMTVMNLALVVMIAIMVADPSIALHGYSKVVAIMMAGWSIYLFVTSIRGLLLIRGKRDPWLIARWDIRFIAALVSVLMLQTALTASFGTGSGEDLLGDMADIEIEVIDVGKEATEGIEEATGVPIWSGVVEKVLPDEEITRDKIVNDQTMEVLMEANRITGVVVGSIVLGLTIYMIVRGHREEKRLRQLG
ncbi:hypothetical protein IKF84_02585 [Candidatus Saccharibacteria bacterium]|nr:hypothetical protein [Candidatus Saccharibacteria bacterium]